MPYRFKKGGIVVETGAKVISLPLSKGNLTLLIKAIIAKKSEFSHQDFANWCSMHFGNIVMKDMELEDVGIDKATYEVLNDVDAQRDIYLVNEFNAEEL